MSTIYFDFNAVYDCAERVRHMAEIIEQEAKKVTFIITTVQSGWTGAGSEAYINYLESVRVNIFERSQKLYSIAEALKGSAIAAEEADREAARRLTEAEAAAAATHTKVQQTQPEVCPPQTTYSPPRQEQSPADIAANTISNAFDIVRNVANQSSPKGRKR